MINAILVMSQQTFLQLRRDLFFVPTMVICLAVAIFASLSFDWVIEGFEKTLFDVGLFGFYLTGIAVSILWGTKIISDAKNNDSIEVELSAPIGRTQWLIGKFGGLAAALLLVLCGMLVIWQAVMLLYRFGWMQPSQWSAFAFIYIGWVVVAASAVFWGSFCSPAVAQFATICTWIIGLGSSLVARTMLENTPALLQGMVKSLAYLWNLQLFNLMEFATNPGLLAASELVIRALYGLMLMLVLISASCVINSRRNIL